MSTVGPIGSVLVGRKMTPGPDLERTPAGAPTLPVNKPCQPTMHAAAGQSRAPPKMPDPDTQRDNVGRAVGRGYPH